MAYHFNMQLQTDLLQVKFKIWFLNTFEVAAVDINGGMHAMVLETVEEITENNQSQGYKIGDHKLIFKNTYDSEEYGKEKKFTINASDTNAPDAFYYVHVEVDLNQQEDYA